MKTLSLPDSAKHIINQYLNFEVKDRKLHVPYYINENYDDKYKKSHAYPEDSDRFKKINSLYRSKVGKGNPIDIKKTLLKLAKKEKFDLKSASPQEIRAFMISQDLGIDCSGFVVWVVNEICKEKYHKSAWMFIKFNNSNLVHKIKTYLRPVQNISVKVLDNRKNSEIISLSNIRPGDLIISWKGEHVLLIIQVIYDKNNLPIGFEYINSTCWYGTDNGVRQGSVKITDVSRDLKDQKWLDDIDKDGTNWTLVGIKAGSHLVRLKFFNPDLL